MELPEENLTPAEAALTSRELSAYRAWKGLNQPRISPDTQAKFFALFLKGETCEEIVRLNKGFSIGQVCQARVEREWDRQRDEYLQGLFDNTRAVLQQATLESVRFIADQLAAVHKKWGEAARRYVQSGDDADFKGFGIDSIRSYKTAVEALQKITGADKKAVEHHHEHHDAAPVARADRPMKTDEASNVIKFAAAKAGRK